MQVKIDKYNTSLQLFHDVLSKHSCPVIDTADIMRCISFHQKGKKSIQCEINNLPIYLRNRSSICFKHDGRIVLFINAKILFFIHPNDNNYIKEYEINILAQGIEDSKFYYCWHFDQDIPSDEKNLVHPYYHMHCGGRGVKERNAGEILLFKAPRIAYPPMDPFLCIHFIFHNFCEKDCYPELGNIFNDGNYKAIIKFSQDMLWEPYFNGLGAESSHEVFNRNKLFPMFV